MDVHAQNEMRIRTAQQSTNHSLNNQSDRHSANAIPSNPELVRRVSEEARNIHPASEAHINIDEDERMMMRRFRHRGMGERLLGRRRMRGRLLRRGGIGVNDEVIPSGEYRDEQKEPDAPIQRIMLRHLHPPDNRPSRSITRLRLE